MDQLPEQKAPGHADERSDHLPDSTNYARELRKLQADVKKLGARPKDRFDKVQAIGQGVMTPIVVVLVGCLFTFYGKQNEVEAAMQNRAIDILRADPTEANRDLRQWAEETVYGPERAKQLGMHVAYDRETRVSDVLVTARVDSEKESAHIAEYLAQPGSVAVVIFGAEKRASDLLAHCQSTPNPLHRYRRALWLMDTTSISGELRERYFRPDALGVIVGLDNTVHYVIPDSSPIELQRASEAMLKIEIEADPGSARKETDIQEAPLWSPAHH